MNVSFDLYPIKNGWILKISYPLENETYYFKTWMDAILEMKVVLTECSRS